MKTSVTITVEVRETRSVRRHRHLSHEHRQKIGQSQRERLEFYRRTKEAEKPKWTPYAARVEAFTSLQEYATAMWWAAYTDLDFDKAQQAMKDGKALQIKRVQDASDLRTLKACAARMGVKITIRK